MSKRPSESASESETLIGFSDIRTLDATDENGRIGRFRTIRTVSAFVEHMALVVAAIVVLA